MNVWNGVVTAPALRGHGFRFGAAPCSTGRHREGPRSPDQPGPPGDADPRRRGVARAGRPARVPRRRRRHPVPAARHGWRDARRAPRRPRHRVRERSPRAWPVGAAPPIPGQHGAAVPVSCVGNEVTVRTGPAAGATGPGDRAARVRARRPARGAAGAGQHRRPGQRRGDGAGAAASSTTRRSWRRTSTRRMLDGLPIRRPAPTAGSNRQWRCACRRRRSARAPAWSRSTRTPT